MSDTIFNQVKLQGWLSKKEYCKFNFTPAGVAVFNGAIDIGLKKGGSWTTQYVPLVGFEKVAMALNDLPNNPKINIEGKLNVREFIDKDKIKRKVIEIYVNSFTQVVENSPKRKEIIEDIPF